jgi:hypothetical protein
MNKGHMMIEASVLLPLIILILLFFISLTLFAVIKTDIELDMNMDFLGSEDDLMIKKIGVDLPLMGGAGIVFEEHREDEDYGMRIQRSKIPGDIFKD